MENEFLGDVEIFNGVLVIALFWMLSMGLYHIGRMYSYYRESYRGNYGWYRTLKRVHKDLKPEIALMTIIAGLLGRTTELWYVRHNFNHHPEYINWFMTNNHEILSATTGVIILGVLCWIRVISPLEGRISIIAWIFMVLSAVVFAYGMLLI